MPAEVSPAGYDDTVANVAMRILDRQQRAVKVLQDLMPNHYGYLLDR